MQLNDGYLMTNIVSTERSLKYISFFRWFFFTYIVVYHAQYALILNGDIRSFIYKYLTHIQLVTDCFFVISGFLLSKHFLSETSFLIYANKRFWSLFPTCLLFWICFELFSSVLNMHVDIVRGYKDIFGLNVFGVPWYHNDMNFTWFCYALFWANVLFFALFKLKKYFLIPCFCIICFSCYTVVSNFQHHLLIVSQPYSHLSLSVGTYRALFACGMGIVCGLLSAYCKKNPIKQILNGWVVSFIEISQILCFAGALIYLSKSSIYVVGIINFSILLCCLSQENGVLYKILNQSVFHLGAKWLLGAYIFSAIALLIMREVSKKNPFFIQHGLITLLLSLILSVLLGWIVFMIISNFEKMRQLIICQIMLSYRRLKK